VCFCAFFAGQFVVQACDYLSLNEERSALPGLLSGLHDIAAALAVAVFCNQSSLPSAVGREQIREPDGAVDQRAAIRKANHAIPSLRWSGCSLDEMSV
jgi:hypothetical protein